MVLEIAKMAAPTSETVVLSEAGKSIKGIISDIAGVLYDSGEGDGVAINGSIDALAKLKQSGIPLRLCTNSTETTRAELVKKLNRLGFAIEPKEVFAPAPAMCKVLKQRGLRPHLLITEALYPDFSEIDQSNPNCVVIGDAADEFSYKNLNKAFQLLMSLEKPLLFSLGKGKYYFESDGLLKLDAGPFMKALEYACDIEAEVVGKPTFQFFSAVLEDMGVKASDALMIGDDVVSDVGGAQACGMKAVLVRTGKYRPSDEKRTDIKPDGVVDNLAHAVDLLLDNLKK